MTSTENYQKQYEEWLTTKDGRKIFIRPILPTDRNLVLDFFNRLSPQSIYMRFLNPIHVLPRDIVYRFTHINYPSEFALVGLIQEDCQDAIVSIARYAYSANYDSTELGVTVLDDWHHQGIGKALLKKVVNVGKANGIDRFKGRIHPDNQPMIQLCLGLGYKLEYSLESKLFEVDIIV